MQIMLANSPANLKQNLGQVLMQQKCVLQPKMVRTRKKMETWTFDSFYWHWSYYKMCMSHTKDIWEICKEKYCDI